MGKRALGFALGVLAVVAAGCGSSPTSSTVSASTTPATPSARPSSAAQLRIVEPAPGQVVHGTTFIVKVDLTGGRIVPQVSTHLTPDTGHIHLRLDGNVVTLLAGAEFQLTGLKPGVHLLQAEFVAVDHAPFDPRVIATVTFQVA